MESLRAPIGFQKGDRTGTVAGPESGTEHNANLSTHDRLCALVHLLNLMERDRQRLPRRAAGLLGLAFNMTTPLNCPAALNGQGLLAGFATFA